MNKLTTLVVVAGIAALTACSGGSAGAGSTDDPVVVDPPPEQSARVDTSGGATKAMTILSTLTATPRNGGTAAESMAGDYIAEFYRDLGIEPDIQTFTFITGGVSRNICASVPGESDRTLIMGAHYDSIQTDSGADGRVNNGATDNASSNSVLMTLVELLITQEITPQHNLIVCSWGAEETGLHGSDFYAENMTQEEIDNTVAYFNVDTIGVGDIMYVYGGKLDTGWVKDYALEVAAGKNIPLTNQPGNNPDFPAGETCNCSDHVGFQNNMISIAYFEATNWDVDEPGCPMDGYCQTEKDGQIIHSDKDNLAYLLEEYPGRFETQIQQYLDVIAALVVELEEPADGQKLRPTTQAAVGDPTATQRYRDLFPRVERSSVNPDTHVH